MRHWKTKSQIGEANKKPGSKCVLQGRWVSSSAIERETKRRENDYFAGEGIRIPCLCEVKG